VRGSCKDHVLSGDLMETRIRPDSLTPDRVWYRDVMSDPAMKAVISFFCTFDLRLKLPSTRLVKGDRPCVLNLF
jgi:hypothetical protein